MENNKNEEQLKTFNKVISEHWEEYRKKLKQYCFLNQIEFSEDVMIETYIKMQSIIQRKGLKDDSEKGILSYFFLGFRNNTYQEHLQNQKRLIDDNINPYDVDIIDEEYDDSKEQFNDLVRIYLEKIIKENFDLITYSVYRLRYLYRFNGKELNYKQIKEITGISDTRRRLVEVNRWIKENVTLDDIKTYAKENLHCE